MPKNTTTKVTPGSQKKSYIKPEILSHESLERVAAGCAKGTGGSQTPGSCTVTPQLS